MEMVSTDDIQKQYNNLLDANGELCVNRQQQHWVFFF
jgi:hypothetical protein